MTLPPIPANELVRLKALYELYILDTPPEERFDRLTRVAKSSLNVPYAFVNLVDSENQWCKSSPGHERGLTPRSISFCAHTILGHEPLIIRDAAQDERFFDNPLVTQAPGFQSYLGVPLFSRDGLCVGALCVLDIKPRAFPPGEINLMRDLAAAVQSELTNLELNKSLTAIRLAQEAAESAIASRKSFLAAVSHEIRTPMNGIVGMTEALADSKLTPDQHEALDTIRECTRTLLLLINDVLDFSKIESGKLALEKVPFDPRASIRHVLALNTHAAMVKGVKLESTINDNVPALVLGDPLRIGQVLLNLIGNALKFTDKGSITVALRVIDLGPDGDPILHFSVRDTGVGIALEGQAKLFQAFAQADSSIARTHGGTGLGLAISKQLVELMGGTIDIHSTPGEGSMFSFGVPFPRGECHKAAAALVPDPAATYDGPPLRILVAEDNLVNQRVFAHALGKVGQKAVYVNGGLDAVARVQQEKFGIIFMDVQMPDLDGLEATRRIRALPGFTKDTPWIIACTADAMPEDRQRCIEAGMNDYTSKPLNPATLRAALARYAQALKK